MANCFGDQAAGLRRLFNQDQLRVITFASGSEGVGKTVAVANLAAAIARQGKEVLVIDENTRSNVASMFGAATKYDLYHVLNRDRRLSEVVVHVEPGVRVLSAARAVTRLGRLERSQREILLETVGAMERPADVILVDASLDHPLGFSPFGLAAHEAVIVASASGSAITEAYALIKKVSIGYARRHFRVLVNKVRSSDDGDAIHANLSQVARQRGVARIDYAGCVPHDDAFRHAAKRARPVVVAYPESEAAAAFRSLADKILDWPVAEPEGGSLEQFVQQLLHFSKRIDPVTIHAG